MINLIKKLFGVSKPKEEQVPDNKIAALASLEKVTGQLDLKPKRKKK